MKFLSYLAHLFTNIYETVEDKLFWAHYVAEYRHCASDPHFYHTKAQLRMLYPEAYLIEITPEGALLIGPGYKIVGEIH